MKSKGFRLFRRSRQVKSNREEGVR